RTPLSYAAIAGAAGIVRLLLDRGDANPDSRDSSGRTPLSFAASGGHEGVVKLLLGRKDVNSNSLDADGRTPLSYATSMGWGGIVNLLSVARSSNCELLENRDRMPSSGSGEIASHLGVIHPFTATQDVPLPVPDDRPLDPSAPGPAPPGPPPEPHPPLKQPLLRRLYLYLALPTLIHSLGSGLESPFFVRTSILLIFLCFAFFGGPGVWAFP
ncbi:ankyrin repeat-containing domain protein, partial [Tuber borchii]